MCGGGGHGGACLHVYTMYIHVCVTVCVCVCMDVCMYVSVYPSPVHKMSAHICAISHACV